MKNFLWAFLIAALILFPKVIFAGDSNYYFSGIAGIFNPNNLDLNDIETIHAEKVPTGEFNIHTDLKDGNAQLEIGTAVLAAIGYKMGTSRVEIEYGYRNAIFSNVSGRSSNYQQDFLFSSCDYIGKPKVSQILYFKQKIRYYYVSINEEDKNHEKNNFFELLLLAAITRKKIELEI